MTASDPSRIISAQLDGIKLATDRIPSEDTYRLVQMILAADTVFVTGQGRSGLIANCLVTRLAQMGIDVHVPGYANCRKIRSGDLLIAVSCSGDTRTTVELVKIAKSASAPVTVLTAIPDSNLAELADHTLIIPSNADDVRGMTSCVVGPMNNTLFEQAMLMYADALIWLLLDTKGSASSVIGQQHTNLE